jgi:hypothetical protein
MGVKMPSDKENKPRRGNRVERDVKCANIIVNHPLTEVWANLIASQDRFLRSLNQKSIIELPLEKSVFWQEKLYEALLAHAALLESATQDTGLEHTYRRLAYIDAIKSNLEALEAARKPKS